MFDPEFVSVVAQFFHDHLRGLRLTRNKNLCFNSTRPIHPSPKMISSFIEHLPTESKGILYTRFMPHIELEFKSFDFASEMESKLVTLVRESEEIKKGMAQKAKEKAAKDAAMEAFFSDGMTTPLARLKLIQNVADRKKSFLYDPAEDHAHKFDYDFVMERLKYILGDSFNMWREAQTEDCHIVFVPDQPRFIETGGRGPKQFNIWTEAEWKKDWVPNPNAVCPIEVAEFFQHFLQDDESRNFCQAWLRDAIFERAEPILVLCGTPGSGKNIFADHMAGNLVGKHNARSASRGFNKSVFHNNVSHCRTFFLDEMDLTPEVRNTLKAYHNGLAAIERKGKDVEDPERLYASFIIANNHERKIKLEYTDRKFYVPLVSKEPLLKTIAPTEAKARAKLDLLAHKLKDPMYLSELASYLFHKFPPQYAQNFPKNDLFKKLCINSYPQNFRRFIAACHDAEEISSQGFNRGARSSMDPIDLRDLIDDYEVNFREPLADLDFGVEARWRAKSKVFKKKETTLLASKIEIDSKEEFGYRNGNGSGFSDHSTNSDDDVLSL